ncbi:MAG: molybdate ABC transporter substrate-binding protein [Tepidiforma sp.]|nr:molybdate ABC transporter substrate-binding protein [Tepidiforma sp.]GIW17280.1 MAG: molybdate ABC transporter substrate-binding protein [Tepidiforma sp.]
MRAVRRSLALVAALAAAAALAACGNGGASGEPQDYVTDVLALAAPGEGMRPSVAIAAASDLRLALDAYRSALETACSASITVTYGSSGQFARQIIAGAPVDLFLSADTRYTDEVAREGRVAPGGMARYARGRIALLVRPGLPLPADLASAASPEYRSIAIANPEHAPYGRAAEEALRNAGIYEQVKGRLVLAENARQSVDYVDKGNADLGIVALPLLAGHDPATFRVLDDNLHQPIDQAGAVIVGTGAERTARCILQQLLSPAAQQHLANYGFEPPSAD